MSAEFATEEWFPLHIFRTNDARWKLGRGHAVEISSPDEYNLRAARLVLKTVSGSKTHLHEDALASVSRSFGPVDQKSDRGEKYKMNWERLPLILIGAILVMLLAVNNHMSSLFGLIQGTVPFDIFIRQVDLFMLFGLIPVVWFGFIPYVRTVVKLVDGDRDEPLFIICYVPKRCYYKLYQFRLLRVT